MNTLPVGSQEELSDIGCAGTRIVFGFSQAKVIAILTPEGEFRIEAEDPITAITEQIKFDRRFPHLSMDGNSRIILALLREILILRARVDKLESEIVQPRII